MLFLDTNSFLIHHELNNEIEQLNDNKKYYQKEIQVDQKQIKSLKNDASLEKFAREEYFMKKENEEIYIIEYEDSLNKRYRDE
ncbi:septum formation initiator family protein [Aquimarina sp. ERC-38]|uniref:FtsB family cell division protein n=1 Tax=Aquimarina sp. ERC-38 TaxID=2949996 RepID=UPI002247DDD6|nr:septum formation initiator family protein [Aquimarina sp. ERC-38]UZO82695.1 septum formation initiator family protein [Aquimarina sp. ERC-38]